jgi:hypothetical protein
MDLASLTSTDLPVSLGYLHLSSYLGDGATGRTFRAESRGLGGLPRTVAVTVLPQSLMHDEHRWRDLQTEVGRAALLRHRGVVRLFSLAVEDKTPYIVSELVEGASLSDLLERGAPLEARQALDVGIQITSALGAAHDPASGSGELPVPHGELRASAVVVGLDGVIKLRGFGLRLVHSSNPTSSALAFASPEALSGQRLSLGSDLFSLGGLLFYALAGRVPFPVHNGASAGERLAAIVKGLRGGGVLAEVDQLVPGLGKAFGRLLCLDPNLRFATAGDVEAVFREVRGGLPRSSRLQEVVTERFGEELLTSSTESAPDAVSQYLVAEPSRRTGKETPVESARTYGAVTTAPGSSSDLLTEASRDLGVPDPPPVPVPRRQIVAAPRTGPTLVDPGQVTMPEKETFRPPSGPGGGQVLDSSKAGEAMDVSAAALSNSSLSVEPSLELDEETTDGDSPMYFESASSGVLPRNSELGSASELNPSESIQGVSGASAGPASPGPRTGDRPPSSRTNRRRRARPAQLLVVVIGVLGLLVVSVGVVAYIQSADRKPTGLSTGSVVSSEDQVGQSAPPADESGASRDADAATEVVEQENLDEGVADAELDLGNQGEGTGAVASGRAQRGSDIQEPEMTPDSSSDSRDRERGERAASVRDRSRDRSEDGPPVSLSITHSPLVSARMGSSELITVRLSAPRSTKVVLHSGPAGGPIKRTRLKAKSGGRWEGWIDFRGTSVGDSFSYWLVATHPRASAPARSGSRSAPHRVAIQ